MNLNDPEVTQTALHLLRNSEPAHWNIALHLAVVLYVYVNEWKNRNYGVVASGLTLVGCQWAYEIANALFQHFTGHAVWTVPAGTDFLILIGVGVEISFMFAIAGVVFSKMMPEDPKARILGMNNRLFCGIAYALFFSVAETFFIWTPTFTWVYPWWGVLPVFATVYVPYWVLAMSARDWRPTTQRRVIGSLFAADAFALVVFAGILGWI
jgi:hypothetical protein